MDFIQGFDRYQIQMMNYDSLVPANSWARIVDLFVDILPLQELGFEHVLPASFGKTAYSIAISTLITKF